MQTSHQGEGARGGLERDVPEICSDYMFMVEEKDGRTLALLVARERESDERCAQHGISEEVEGRVDMSKADGTSS